VPIDSGIFSSLTVTPSGVVYGMKNTYFSTVDDADVYTPWWGGELCIVSTTDGSFSVLAGNPYTPGGGVDGSGTNALFQAHYYSKLLAWNEFMGVIIVADGTRIRKVTLAGVITTIAGAGIIPPSDRPYDWGNTPTADGVGLNANFGIFTAIAIVPSNGNILVAEYPQVTIRLITPLGLVTTLAGPAAGTPWVQTFLPPVDGPASTATVGTVWGLSIIPSSGIIVLNNNPGVIRFLYPDGSIATVAGSLTEGGYQDGPGATALFGSLVTGPSLCVLPKSEMIVIADGDNLAVRLMGKDGFVTTVVGPSANLEPLGANGPYGIWVLSEKKFLITDFATTTSWWVTIV